MPAAELCGECLRKPPAFGGVLTAAAYQFPLDAAIQRLKYGQDLALVAPLAALLIGALADQARPDLVVPMPLARARLRERGFNQAAELARWLTASMGLRLSLDAARRTRETAPQASLPFDERARNIRNAFAASSTVAGLRVAVVDDVLTTGATLHELAKALRRAGAREVTGWVLARTPRG
jgi:ComF family protein